MHKKSIIFHAYKVNCLESYAENLSAVRIIITKISCGSIEESE